MFDEVKASHSQKEWSALGFHQTADNYWTLTQFVIRSFEQRGDNRVLWPVGSDGREHGTHLKTILSAETE